MAQFFAIKCEFLYEIIMILLNILGTRSNFTTPQPYYKGVNTRPNSNNLLDLRNFNYKISLDCKAPQIIWIVTSYAGDNSKRNVLRRAYNSQELDNLGIQRIFLLAKLDDSQQKSGISQMSIENESHKFKDIIQGNFLEAYRNLSYKHIMGLKWSVENCPKAPYILKMDDDVIINLYDILDKLKIININNSLAGRVVESLTPFRDTRSKWYVSKEEFPLNSYPRYLSGMLYLTTLSVASKLINQAKYHLKYFWIDDVFVTGILREESKIALVDIKEMYSLNTQFLKCCIEGGRNGWKCDITILLNHGDPELQMTFKKFANSCRSTCKLRPKHLSVLKTCDLANKG